jgi:general secretion pathway protein G
MRVRVLKATRFPVAARNKATVLAGIALVAAMLLVAVGLFSSQHAIVDTKMTQAKQQLTVLKSALERYRVDRGHYPSQQDGLGALVDPTPGGKYLANDYALKDPWGRPFRYQFESSPTGENFTLYSVGPDGAGTLNKPNRDLVVHN